MTMTQTDFTAWLGREESSMELITPAPVSRLGATLDHRTSTVDGAELPPLWHWLYFLPSAQTSELASDGHPQKGGFLPPIPKPRRMWAGSQIQFLAPIPIGAVASKRSTISDITHKEGRTGSLYFVKVRHEVSVDGQLAVIEDQDIVYRDPVSKSQASNQTAAEVMPQASWSHNVVPTEALLFRYSALTFNSHRIHYDRPYATEVEGYAGLVVHGPLLATLMLDLVRRELPTASIQSFSFKAQRPQIDTTPFRVCGTSVGPKELSLWIEGKDGVAAAVGVATVN